ncbi:MAG: Rne/Rng family ribonuclease, partial [Clostridia bacterium]|nr:Rne/Rng family ribonuclease [Clostridia bacterium]
MKNKIYIDMHASRTKVAVTEEGDLVELYVERETTEKLIGNIYKGRVENVLNGMQSAFVNIGLSKNAFLYVHESNMVDGSELLAERRQKPSSILDKVGDEIMVQVVKEQFGTKGVRITKDITIPGRYIVLMPLNDYIGISRKITDEKTRERLTKIIEEVKEEGVGYILRTASKNATAKEIKKEAKNLYAEYKRILDKFEKASPGQLVYKESGLVERTIRDVLNEDTEEIIINNEAVFSELKERFSNLMPEYEKTLKYYPDKDDMFDAFGLNEEIEDILKRKVPLTNGAYLIIDRTEAFTIIDVNTGRYVGENNHEETVFTTNMIAADEIARQLRLRNLGGIIIVDFID